VNLAASGGTGSYTWTRTSGSLPNGLAMNSSGVISGTPTKVGNFTFTVRASDGTSSASKVFTLKVAKH
jgi:hypothetical protein